MKEILIIIISILLVCVGASVSQAYLDKTSTELIENIDELSKEIEKAQSLQENSSEELANNIYDRWKEVEEKWSLIVMHSELDNIELSLIGMKTCIKENEYERSMEELEKSKFLLEHITEKEQLELKNIF